jgi:hypothetical protein
MSGVTKLKLLGVAAVAAILGVIIARRAMADDDAWHSVSDL